ncbi:hypothetical protein AB0N38_26415 [Micromonospora aurantiaca]|uniref:hypothetical protein n=1 Tax=Micromonospora aurantiaca (nom. illeg.) TaxID=47850 RepID=UPI0034129488
MTRPPLDLADLHHLPWSPAPRPGDELPPPTPDNPTPGRPGPCHRSAADVDTEIVGRLRFLTAEIAHLAADYDLPADLRHLIGEAKRIAHGDLPAWQPENRRAA